MLNENIDLLCPVEENQTVKGGEEGGGKPAVSTDELQ